ncbi:MAG: hypothetical protein IT443_06530 [Phycisphaeraceae bacterium]|nr:hypothetical protein [Phycisphaeraceae bacterium]
MRLRAPRLLMISLLGLVLWGLPWNSVQGQTAVGISGEAILADQLVLLARQVLQGQGEPRPDQVVRARVLLDQALKLNDQDAEVWRLYRELCRLAGDTQGEVQALRSYIKLQPQDDVAQLALIAFRVQELQTVPSRVDLLENLLATGHTTGLSDALRSRIATMIALMSRDAGDWDRFRKYLGQAVSLDSTNSQAATLLYEFAVNRNASPMQQGQALLNLVQAAPMSTNARRSLADLLLAERAYGAASIQYQSIAQISQEPLNDWRFFYAWAVSLVGDNRANEALDLLNQVDAMMRQASTPPPAPEGTQPAEPQTQPDNSPLGLSVDLEQLRLAILEGLGQTPGADTSFGRIQKHLEAQIAAGNKDAAGLLAWTSVISNRGLDRARQILAQGDLDPNSVITQLLGGWLKLREGDYQAAAQAFTPLQATEPFAVLGLAMLKSSDDPQRQELLKQVIERGPASAAAVSALMELRRQKVVVQMTSTGSGLVERLKSVLVQISNPDPNAGRWVSLSLEMPNNTFVYLEPIPVKITLRNLSPLPLSVGPNGTIPTTLFIQIVPRRGGSAMAPINDQVVDLSTRLRLNAGEALTVDGRLDRGGLGGLIASIPTETIGLTVMGLLNPRYQPDGSVVPGMLGDKDTQVLIERRGMPVSEVNAEGWIATLDDPDRVERIRALGRLTLTAAQVESSDPGIDALVRRMAESVVKRFVDLDPTSQALVVRFIPAGDRGTALFGGALDMARRSDNTLVKICYLATQVASSQDPTLDAGLRSNDADVRKFAEAVRQSLSATASASQPDAQQFNPEQIVDFTK